MEDVYWVYNTPRIGNAESHSLIYGKHSHNLNKKHYFNTQSTCSICFEPLQSPKNVILTDCGHCFHCTCLFKYYRIKGYDIVCPLCRTDIVDFVECKKIYQNPSNLIDTLENFWYTIHIQLPRYCCSNFKHYCGTSKNCKYCQNYNKTGNYTNLNNKTFMKYFKYY